MQKWHVVPDRNGVKSLTNDGSRIVMEDDTRIALVCLQSQSRKTDAWQAECNQRDANARLISAAPELYAALKELAAAYDNYDGGSISEKRIQAAVDGAESALAKATGA